VVLDLLEPSDSPDYDPADELRLLEEVWPEKLEIQHEGRY
jgi:hypothetical protein